MTSFFQVLKGFLIYLAILILLAGAFIVSLKDIYADLNRYTLELYEPLAFWALIIFSLLCLVIFVIAAFFLLGQDQKNIFQGVLLAFLFNIIYLIYLSNVYVNVFVESSMELRP